MAPGEWPLQPSHPSSVSLPAVPAVACCGRRSEDRCSHVGWGGAAAASSQVVASALSPPAGLILPARKALVWTRFLATDPRAQKGSPTISGHYMKDPFGFHPIQRPAKLRCTETERNKKENQRLSISARQWE